MNRSLLKTTARKSLRGSLSQKVSLPVWGGLVVLLACAAPLATATNFSTMDFAAGYADGNLAGQNGWIQTGTNNIAGPVQVAAGTVTLKGQMKLPQSTAKDVKINLSNPTTVFVNLNLTVTKTHSAGQGVFALQTVAGGAGVAYGRLYIKSGGAGFNLGLNTSGGGVVYGATELALNTPYKIVIAYESKSGNANDVGHVYVNPTGGAWTEWAAELTQTSTAAAEPASFKSLVLQQGQLASGTYNEVKITKMVIGDTPVDSGL